MAKETTIDQLVWAAEGPKQKVPTYQFRRRVFKEYEKPPGQRTTPNDQNPGNG